MRPRLAEAASIQVEDLVVHYGSFTAVDGLTLEVAEGSIHGVVGPNGAGKSTTVDCVLGLRGPTSGTVRTCGLDPMRHRRQVHRHLGVMLQENSLYKRIRVEEAVRLFASFSSHPRPVDELLAALQLADHRRSYYGSLSGGQRRLLLLALAAVGSPEVLVLDEPTSGLDLHAGNTVWALLRAERARGATVLLTTHDLVEAQRECDVVTIIDHGRVVAGGPPTILMSREGVETRVSAPSVPAAPAVASRCRSASDIVFADEVGNRLVIVGTGRDFVHAVSDELCAAGVRPTDVEIGPATFEDLYLLRTGRSYHEAEMS